MSAVILTLLFLFFQCSQVSAYTYQSYIDLYSLPDNQDIENSITYDSEEVDNNENIVKAPPSSEVVFGVEGDFQNDILDARIFLSKDNIYQGDLTRILDIDLPFEEFNFLKNGTTRWRYGRMYSLENTLLNYGKNPLLIAQVSQPLKVLEYTYDIQEGVAEIRVVVKNSSDRTLEYIRYAHEEFSLTREFSAGEEYTYEYSLEYENTGEGVDLGFPRISDPNSRYLCSAGTNTVGNPHNIFLIENGTTYLDSGTTLQDDFCIEQLGYTLNLGRVEKEVEKEDELVANINNSEQNVDTEEETEEEEENIEDVLGIDILPKTSVDMYGYIFLGIFLVAFGILCYYFNDEDTVCNA